MKKQIVICALALVLSGILWSCDEMVNNSAQLPNGLNGLFTEQIRQATQKFTVNADKLPVSITGKYGTVLTFQGLWGHQGNSSIRGNVQVEFIEIYTVADMLLLNKPTLGYSNGALLPLQSGGEFFVSAKQNGFELAKNYSLVTPPTTQLVPGMQVFTGDQAGLDTMGTATISPISWFQTPTRAITCADTGGTRVGTYCLNFQSSSWCNIDKFMDTTKTIKPLKVVVPVGLVPPNVQVYLTVVNVKSLIPLYLYQNNAFTANYALKQGTEINIVVVADDNGTLKYAIQRTKITDNQTETIPALNPITVAELRNKISAL
jgi:hypothetical protein